MTRQRSHSQIIVKLPRVYYSVNVFITMFLFNIYGIYIFLVLLINCLNNKRKEGRSVFTEKGGGHFGLTESIERGIRLQSMTPNLVYSS